LLSLACQGPELTRFASVATDATSSPGSTGLARCI